MKATKTRETLEFECDAVFESLNWWREEIAKTIEEAEKLEDETYRPDYEERMDDITKKMQNLCARGEFEIKQLDRLEEEINESAVSRVFSPLKFLKKPENEK